MQLFIFKGKRFDINEQLLKSLGTSLRNTVRHVFVYMFFTFFFQFSGISLIECSNKVNVKSLYFMLWLNHPQYICYARLIPFKPLVKHYLKPE